MAEITRRRSGELLRGIFTILRESPDGLPAKDVLQRMERVVPPTDFEKQTYPRRPSVRRYEKIIRFSTITVVKAGWLLKEKGSWSLTDEGRKAFEKFTDPENFATEAARLYREWSASQPETEEIEIEEDQDSPGPTATLEEAVEAAWGEVEQHLTNMPPYDFQNLVAGLLSAMGYHVNWVAPPGPDRGIDIIAYSDPLGVRGPRIKVQVKRTDRIDAKEIRSFMSVLADGDVGIFVSTGGFTKASEDEARNQERRRLILLNLQRLFDLWVEHYDKIPESARRLLPLKRVFFLAPMEGSG